ncbi:MAG: radical SAM protein [Bacillota bacterium]
MQLLYADKEGNYYEHPTLRPAGRTGDRFVQLVPEDMTELPSGASLVLIPGGSPVGVSGKGSFILADREYGGEGPAYSVGALLPQGYTRTFLPAFRRRDREKPLPLMGYAAVAWRRGRVYVAAVKTDDPHRWDPVHYNTPDLPRLVRALGREMPGNRIVKQLSRCALSYSCFTAQNIFYGRWEGGIPVSRTCNAACLGCISLQPAECCPSPQSRIDFSPTVDEVVELGLRHLQGKDGPIISFGQGCEGEPAMAWEVISEALMKIRGSHSGGTININTNAGNTRAIEALCRAGLDSVRVSLISARDEVYNSYYRPRGYSLGDVMASIRAANKHGVFVSLNLLVFPGLTDREEEVEALIPMIRDTGVNMVQLRNLNIDPDYLFGKIPPAKGDILGIPALISALESVSGLELGNFSRPVNAP